MAIEKFMAKFFYIRISDRPVPLFIHIEPDHELNSMISGKDSKLDLEIFFDQSHSLPNIDKHEGYFSGVGTHVIRPFGKCHFTEDYMYFGLFS